MHTRAFFTLAALVGFILICGNTYAFFDSKHTRLTLKGLKGVFVLVEDLNEEVVKDGLTRDDIRTDVEQKLRLAAIPVFSQEESYKEPGVAILVIFANIGKQAKRSYVCYIQVSLTQDVTLVRSPDVKTIGQTWSTGGIGWGMELKDIRDRIKHYVGEFINAYLSVNPK